MYYSLRTYVFIGIFYSKKCLIISLDTYFSFNFWIYISFHYNNYVHPRNDTSPRLARSPPPYLGRVGHVPPWQGGGFLPIRATVTAGTSGHQSSSSAAPPRHPGSLIRLEFLLGRSSSVFCSRVGKPRRPWCSVYQPGLGLQLRISTSQNTGNKINWVEEC